MDAPRHKGVLMKSDAQIQQAVLEEFMWDT